MNKFFVNTIYKILAEGIEQGYKSGIKSIQKDAKSKFIAEDLELFAKLDVNYTSRDKEAIKNFKVNAFKVAGVGSYELEEELKKLGIKVLENEIPDYDSFEVAVRQKMLDYGIGLGDQPPGGWIKQNLDHAIKSSIAGARWIRVTDPSLNGLYKAWVYHTQNDDRVRDEHAILEGRVFRISDSAASKMIPPNDWGCRCYPEYITADEADGRDITKHSESKELLNEIPEDFRYNPGVEQDIWNRWLDQKLADLPDKELKALNKMVREEFKK